MPGQGPVPGFLSGLLSWTNQKNAPPWAKPGDAIVRRPRSLNGFTSWDECSDECPDFSRSRKSRVQFLVPIIALEGEACWSLLAPFTETYICAYIFDAAVVPDGAVSILDLCLGRFLACPNSNTARIEAGSSPDLISRGWHAR